MLGIIGPTASAVQIAQIRWLQHQSGRLRGGHCSVVEVVQASHNEINFIIYLPKKNLNVIGIKV
jgi:hypothetical protein